MVYNLSMIDFGVGPSLQEACPWLRDEAARHNRILDVVERDSVIEGLPEFTPEFREQLRQQLRANGDLVRVLAE